VISEQVKWNTFFEVTIAVFRRSNTMVHLHYI
jgi:hypothetical protein